MSELIFGGIMGCVLLVATIAMRVRRSPSPYPERLASENDEDYAKRLVIAGFRLEAVSVVRKATGMSLKDAVAWVDRVTDDM
jgi:hypothetical protein